MSVWYSPFNDAEEFLVQGAGNWTCLALAHCYLVYGADRRDLSGGTGKEGFICDVQHLAWNHLLHCSNAQFSKQLDRSGACNTWEPLVPNRSGGGGCVGN